MLLSLGGLLVRRGGTSDSPWNRFLAIINGVGLLVVLVAGFGLLARLGVPWPWPTWVLLKILLWVTLGFMTFLLKKLPSTALLLWWLSLVLASTAAYLAIFKPV